MAQLLSITGNSLFTGALPTTIGSQSLAVIIAAAIISIAIFFASRYIAGRLDRSRRDFLASLNEQNRSGRQVISERMENTEKAVASFAYAMQEYAKHLASHTSAIQGLSEASQALKNSTIEQNHVLHQMSDTLVKRRTREDESRVERAVIDLERRTALVLEVKDELERKRPPEEPQQPGKPVTKELPQRPRGCRVKPRAFYNN